jgi:outer membrane protein OmpA-like peptidoglycan-associated protein
MEGSPLDLVNSDAFRKKLVVRNLTPYAKSPNRPSFPINIPYIQTDSSVQDSPDQLIDEPSLANVLYPLNQWGAEGGYKQVPDPGALLNTKSNEGEYGPGQQDAHILDQASVEQYNWKPKNAYSNGTQGVLDSGEYITEPDWIRSGTPNLYNNQPYPTTFVPSSYAPVAILFNPDPTGSNGLLSQDSYLAQLGAKTLKKGFEERIATNIYQNTVGRANLFNVYGGTDILNLVTTRVPLIEPNWAITVPENPVLAATDFALRLAGSIIPVSPIPGSYFDTSIVLGQPTTIQQLRNAFRQSNNGVGKFFSRLLGADKTGSQIFLNNTGGGQKSRLFGNLKFNRFKPGYDRNVFDRLAGVLVGTQENNSNYYIGSVTTEPSQILSPAGSLPVSEFGAEIQAPVYGPSEIAQLYEGPNRQVRIGANGQAYADGGGIEGGLTWVSPKYKGNAGKKVGVNGEVTNPDENFRPSSFVKTESTNVAFRNGSIMDDTQRLIDSQPAGGKRLQHVGNAIDQVSKVFNDGYKEMTKGSRVLTYVGSLGQEVGTEYCRVFSKDLPYSEYSDLQKTDGVVNEGRRFSYSVFDKTYNLNMYPNKQEGGQDSSNLIGTGDQAYAKKYMFSIENLAWRTSHTPGVNVNDLPICERGPNGGRVMWFPPYALTFTENSRASWKENDFLGRPEKIYTYTNSSRDGTINFKIVVDHPSVLNVIVNKVLSNATNSDRINGLLDSFFAGCKKYDLYELAKKYYTISPNELADLQQIISSKDASKEVVGAIRDSQASGALDTGNQSQNTTQSVQQTPSDTFKQFQNFALFFPNAQPVQGTVQNYSNYYSIYSAQMGGTYQGDSVNFFDNVINKNYDEINNKLIDKLAQYLKDNPNSVVTIFLEASASAPGSNDYNLALSERRGESVIKFFSENSKLKNYVDSKRLVFPPVNALGENGEVRQYNGTTFIPNVKTQKCSDIISNTTNLNDNNPNITNQTAMACRRVSISRIQVSSPQTAQKPAQPNIPSGSGLPSTNQQRPIPQADIEPKFRKSDWVTKRIVRNLISECDYFETIKQETPMVYDNLKQKLKFFQPGFHSTTPEGLNSRLTFLQQCLRPGDTIPTVNPQPNGSYQLDFNNAINSAFGIPPVLVLRIGDFYHTKIIPNSLQLSFEGLDINPEGIGIQPMIATVSLGFNFVGGQGLQTAIDKLQNALSFNYYANTEMWDERADPTDVGNLQVISNQFLQMVQNPSAPTTNQIQNLGGLNNFTTIGNKIVDNITSTGETGVLSYTQFMDNVLTQTQSYFQTIFNQSRSTFKQYNNAILQQWSLNNIYQNGTLYSNPAQPNQISLYGKNDSYQTNIDYLFSQMIQDIQNDEDGFIKFISSSGVDFSAKAIRLIKDNYLNFVKNKKNTFSNPLSGLIQDTTNKQQTFIQYLSRINTVLFVVGPSNGTDGFQQKNGNLVIYDLKQKTNEYVEIQKDSEKIGQSIKDYYEALKSKTDFKVKDQSYSGFLTYWDSSSNYQQLVKNVFYPFSKKLEFGQPQFKRQYAILSNDLKGESYNTFKNAIIGQLLTNPSLAGKTGKDNFAQVFDQYWLKNTKPLFDEEDELTTAFLDKLEKEKLKNFLTFTPYPLGKIREFTFIRNDSPTDGQKKLIKSLGAVNNSNKSKTNWNTEEGSATNVFISKVKLN